MEQSVQRAEQAEAWTRTEWRQYRRVSKSAHHKMLREKKAPKEYQQGGKHWISFKADAEWFEHRLNPSDAEKRLLQREAEVRKRKAIKAAAASVAARAKNKAE